jgi:predicted DNA-binding protein
LSMLLLYIISKYKTMNKSVFFRLTDEEFLKLEEYCIAVGRTKSDVLRDLIRGLKSKKKQF